MANMSIKRTPMKTQSPETRKKNFDPVFGGYTQEEAIEEASRCLNCKAPKCVLGCPVHNEIPEFLEEVRNSNFLNAYKILLRNTCMPDICGTICPHEDQCSGGCVRGLKGEPVNIGAVERFVADWVQEHGYAKDKKPKSNGIKVAAIGSGPASMAFALKMAQKGYKVTIFEKENYLGGVLTWGIPSYRLEPYLVENYFDRLVNLGVEFVLNKEIGKNNPLDEICKDFAGVFLATGATISNQMHIPGEDLEGVFHADNFLTKINLDNLDKNHQRHFDKCGKRVLVVGGGNVAMDAARDAIRLPQVEKVTIVYRRSENEMPACFEELNHAKEEGIEFKTLCNPVAFIGNEGKVVKAECAIMELGEPDSSGRRRPIESDKPHIFIDVDTVVLALGFSNSPEIGDTTKNLDIDKWGCFIVDENYKTSRKNTYAGGDAVTGAKTVVLAMKAGIKAAQHLDSVLRK